MDISLFLNAAQEMTGEVAFQSEEVDTHKGHTDICARGCIHHHPPPPEQLIFM